MPSSKAALHARESRAAAGSPEKSTAGHVTSFHTRANTDSGYNRSHSHCRGSGGMLSRRGATQGRGVSADWDAGSRQTDPVPQASQGSFYRVLFAVLATCAGILSLPWWALEQAKVATDLSIAVERGRGTGQQLLGVSEGNYSLLDGGTCGSCGARIRRQCGHPFVHEVPKELLVPGRLGSRESLSETALCFLWYAKSFWMRGTGGSKGLMHFRLGGVDNKAQFARHMASYETRYGCQPFQITPATINLSDATACASFYSNNSQWDPPHLPPAAAEATRIWFVKAEMGSLGTHISLQSGASITANRDLIQEQKRPTAAGASLAAAAAANETRERNESVCPRRGAVASLGVADLWLLKGKKFDMRVYVLVPSVEPLLVFFRPGHLRVSALSYLPFGARRARRRREGGGVGGGGGGGPTRS